MIILCCSNIIFFLSLDQIIIVIKIYIFQKKNLIYLIREAEKRVIILLWVACLAIILALFFVHKSFLILGWSSWDCSCYQRRSKEGAEKEPWRSSTLYACRSWTKIGSRYWWKVSDVCIRPELTRNAAQLELELHVSFMLSCFSVTESTGKV